MSAKRSRIVSEVDTEAQAASHDRWFRAKVEEAMSSTQPRLPHDQAMAKVNAELDARRAVRARSLD